MNDPHDAMEKLGEARQFYLQAIDSAVESLKAERAAVASQTRSLSLPTQRPAKPRAPSGSAEPPVCTAARDFLQKQGPRGLTDVHEAVRRVPGLEETSKGALSAALSRSPDFFSKQRKWRLLESRGTDPGTSASTPVSRRTSHDT